MASVTVRVYSGSGDYEVSLDHPETNGQVWGSDKSHLDAMVDEAVRQIKRAYTDPAVSDAE